MKRLSIAKLRSVEPHRKPGYMEAVFAAATISTDTHVEMSDADYLRIRRRYSMRVRRVVKKGGPGSILKAMLATVGITADKSCPCNTMARKMDEWGPDESLKHIDEIVAVMEKTASKRKMIFSRLAAKALVRLAIWRSRRATR